MFIIIGTLNFIEVHMVEEFVKQRYEVLVLGRNNLLSMEKAKRDFEFELVF